MNDTKNIKKLIYNWFIAFLWSQTILINYIENIFKRIPFFGRFSPYIFIVAFVLLLILALNYIVMDIKIPDIYFWMVCAIVILLNYFIFENTRSYVEEWWVSFLFTCLPLYFIGVSLPNKMDDELFDLLTLLSVATVFCFTIYKVILNRDLEYTTYDSDMYAAYNVLPHICLLCYAALKKKKIMQIIGAGIGVVVLPLLGNRGSVLCLAVFVALCVLVMYGRNHPFLLAFFIMVVTIVLLYTPIFENIVVFFKDLAEKNNMSTRIFDRILSNELTLSKGRENLRQLAWKEISENPLIGKGIMSDRYILGKGSYAHNIVLEMFLNYGVIVGGVLLITIIILGFKALRRNINNHDILCLLFICFCSGFIKMFMSGSYLEEPYFYLLLGLCLGTIRKKQPEVVESDV